jgi:hypothetical protein
MPPKKGNSTPNKPPDNPTWTLDEGEEMRRDINDLQNKTVTKDELQEMEAKLEAINTKMDGLKGEIMEGLKNFLIERTPESENVSHEIHDEDTRKVNQEWRNSNFGLKTNHVPKINMRKFDGKDPITWILQMEQLFDLHNVPHTQKVQIASLYLEPNQFVWYRWLCSRKSLVTWTIFTEEMIEHYEDTRSNTFFSQLINLKQKGSVTKHIEKFQRLNIKVTNIPDEHLIDVFIGTLKDNIQHEVLLWEPKSLENAFRVARNVESKNMAMATRRTNPNIYRENNAPSSKTPQPTRLTPQQLEERKAKGLCFNCNNKYSKGHKCGEKKLFYIDCEEEEEQEQEHQQEVLQILKDNLTMAQNHMKQQADQHRSERSFEVGDWVFLRLQPYKQISLKQSKKDNKLSPKYYGPYKVLQKIGTMAYKLELPASSRVHPVFHVSCLKKVIGDKIPVQTIFPELDVEGKIILEPESITDTRLHRLRNRSISEYLIKWRKLLAGDSTWEDESFIHKHLELLKHFGQHLSQGEGHVEP